MLILRQGVRCLLRWSWIVRRLLARAESCETGRRRHARVRNKSQHDWSDDDVELVCGKGEAPHEHHFSSTKEKIYELFEKAWCHRTRVSVCFDGQASYHNDSRTSRACGDRAPSLRCHVVWALHYLCRRVKYHVPGTAVMRSIYMRLGRRCPWPRVG